MTIKLIFCIVNIYNNKHGRHKKVTLKTSKYNFFFTAPDGAELLFNSTTTGFAKLDPDSTHIVKEMLASPNDYECDTEIKKDIKQKLISGRFLINSQENELLRLKISNRTGKFNNQSLGLTIAPTLSCNFRCTYCFEDPKKQKMTPTVEKAIVELVEKRVNSIDKLSITWFGGEPLLALDVMERLTKELRKICKKYKCDYTAGIITNGYLWDRKTALKCKRLGVKSAQITLDGPPDVHDKRRLTVNKKGTFDRILKNIEKTYDILPISIRVNTDKDNADRVSEIVDIFITKGLHNKTKLYFAKVEAYTETCANISGSCHNCQEYSALEVELCRNAQSKGFITSRYPRPFGSGYCGAEGISALVVSPSGLVFKCWNQISGKENEAVGDLVRKDLKLPEFDLNLQKWLGWDIFEKTECLDCKILPICMGGCPYNAMKESDKNRGHCQAWKYNLIDMLQLKYQMMCSAPQKGG